MMRPVNRFSRISLPAKPTAKPPIPPMVNTELTVALGRCDTSARCANKTARTVKAQGLEAEYRAHNECQHAHDLVNGFHPSLAGDVALDLELPCHLTEHAALDVVHDSHKRDDKRERQRAADDVLNKALWMV